MHDGRTDGGRGEHDEDDEIEILEIVGLDEDSPGARPRRTIPPRGAAGVAERRRSGTHGDPGEGTDDDGIVLDLDDDTATGDGPGGVATSETDRLLRLRADFDNFKRRVEREREAAERHASAGLVLRMLPVLDNFERALAAAAVDPEGLRVGVELIFRQLLEELRHEGLAAVDSVGEAFDPEVHEAVATTAESDLPPHTIVEELQRGYLLHDRLLRPALVKVVVDPGGGGEGGV